jgi:hypothetical protein
LAGLLLLAYRKARLVMLLARAPERIVYSDHLDGDGGKLFRKVGELGADGIVSKRAERLTPLARRQPGPKSSTPASARFRLSAMRWMDGGLRRCS